MVQSIQLTAADGARRIGRFGFLRPQFEAKLWTQAAALLRGFAATP